MTPTVGVPILAAGPSAVTVLAAAVLAMVGAVVVVTAAAFVGAGAETACTAGAVRVAVRRCSAGVRSRAGAPVFLVGARVEVFLGEAAGSVRVGDSESGSSGAAVSSGRDAGGVVGVVCDPPLLLTITPGATSVADPVAPDVEVLASAVDVGPVVPAEAAAAPPVTCCAAARPPAVGSGPVAPEGVDDVSDAAGELVDDPAAGAPVSAEAKPYPVLTAAHNHAASASAP